MTAEKQEKNVFAAKTAIIRAGEWDCTPGIPRALDSMAKIGLKPTIFCWDLSGKRNKHEVVDGLHVYRFIKRIPPRSPMLFLCWPMWWFWVIRQLVIRDFELV